MRQESGDYAETREIAQGVQTVLGIGQLTLQSVRQAEHSSLAQAAATYPGYGQFELVSANVPGATAGDARLLPDKKDSAKEVGCQANPFQVERDSSGRPTRVSDRAGKVLREIEWDIDGQPTVKESFGNYPSVMKQTGPGEFRVEYEDGSRVTVYGTFTVDKEGNIRMHTTTADGIVEPDGTYDQLEHDRKDWKNMKPEQVRKVQRDEEGIMRVTEIDGRSFNRNHDGKSWDIRYSNGAFGGVVYDLKDNGHGEITYETNEVGIGRWQHTERADGSHRFGPKREGKPCSELERKHEDKPSGSALDWLLKRLWP